MSEMRKLMESVEPLFEEDAQQYKFRDKNTGKVKMLSVDSSKLDDFLADHPHLEQILDEDQYTTRQVVGHRDNETRMMQRALVELRHHTDELLKMMDDLDEGDYPHWWQAKLVKANDYIGKLKHFLMHELELGPRSSDSDDVEMFRKEIAMGDGFKDFE